MIKKKNTAKRYKSIEFNIDNANNDHCGSELCSKQKVKKENEIISFFDDEYYPYYLILQLGKE